MQALSIFLTKKLSAQQLFMISVMIVNAGNYLYNLILGRTLGPELFADAAILITFLLVLSFMAMTYQLAAAKFSVIFNGSVFNSFVSRIYRHATFIGFILGMLIIIFAKQLQIIFNTSSCSMFIIFGVGVPVYFIMSVNRGVFQGKKAFKSLSITYQTEMLSRLLITLALIYFFENQSIILVALGITISFAFGLIPFKIKNFNFNIKSQLDNLQVTHVKQFFIITAFYELTQIIINNSDILLVKHYFESYEAGLYASLALIGRIVYFVAWMFVMLLLPTVVQLKKENKETAPILFKYLVYIASIAFLIVVGCMLFPETVITVLFGKNYLTIAPLLWKYAVATSLFALSNIFAYYYLSLDNYIPVVFSGVFGMLQIGLVVVFHKSLGQVVHMQIIAMLILLFAQCVFFICNERNSLNKIANRKLFSIRR